MIEGSNFYRRLDSPVYYQEADGYVEVVFNQPQKKNCMNAQLARIMPDLFEELAQINTPFIVFRGAGGTFCSGGDLRFLYDRIKMTSKENQDIMLAFYNNFLMVRFLPQITIALMEGAAIGAGLCFAMACDYRIIEANCRLSFNFVRLGINPGMGAFPMASELLGFQRARKLLLTGQKFLGRQFHAWGGADFCFENEAEGQKALYDLMEEHRDTVPMAIAQLKHEIAYGFDFNYFLSLEAQGQSICYSDEDFARRLEGMLVKNK